jgi:hypothetical protein
VGAGRLLVAAGPGGDGQGLDMARAGRGHAAACMARLAEPVERPRFAVAIAVSAEPGGNFLPAWFVNVESSHYS